MNFFDPEANLFSSFSFVDRQTNRGTLFRNRKCDNLAGNLAGDAGNAGNLV